MIKAVFIVNNNPSLALLDSRLRAQRIYDESVVAETLKNFDNKNMQPHEVFFNLVNSQQQSNQDEHSQSLCNFVESEILPPECRIVYRSYASLTFIFCVDEMESSLGMIDVIHVLVKILDAIFSDVSEVNLIFNPHRLNYILDEIIVDGIICEINIAEVVKTIQ